MMTSSDTICAIATAWGGAIGIIRVSGGEAISIADKIFKPATKGGEPLSGRGANTVTYGRIVDERGETVDDVLVSLFRKPRSYTGEDSVEISCHGSRYILEKVLRLLIGNGCRQATAGEYTQRAFMGGKMDLSRGRPHRLAVSRHPPHGDEPDARRLLAPPVPSTRKAPAASECLKIRWEKC